MKSVEETEAELLAIIDEQIVVRREMLPILIGNLYPGIVSDEIDKLRAWRDCIKAQRR